MRLDDTIREFLKVNIQEIIPEAEVYLFGSRTDDQTHGGDIDILILTKKKIDKRILRPLRIEFFKKFGWQKLDLVNFTYENQSAFLKLIRSDAIPL